MDGFIRWVTFRCARCGAEWEGNPGDDIDLCDDCYDAEETDDA